MTNAQALAAILTNMGGTPAAGDTIAELLAKLADVVEDFGGEGDTYTLPTASTEVLGGVKVDGTTIVISDGVISVASSGQTG